MSGQTKIGETISNSVVQNWLGYYHFKFFCCVIVMGTLLFVSMFPKSPLYGRSLLLSVLVSISITFLIMINGLGNWLNWFKAINENPIAYVKAERFTYRVQIFAIIIFFLGVPLIGPVGLGFWELVAQVVPEAFHSLVWLLLYPFAVIFFVELEILNRLFLKVPLLNRAKARIYFTLAMLSDSSRKGREEATLFKEVLKMYNGHVRKKFGFVIREPNRFYRYFVLAAQSNKKTDIKKAKKTLEKLLVDMEVEEHQPADVIRTLRTMLGERKYSLQNIYDEIEVEPRLRKWLYAHSDEINMVVGITALLVTIIALLNNVS